MLGIGTSVEEPGDPRIMSSYRSRYTEGRTGCFTSPTGYGTHPSSTRDGGIWRAPSSKGPPTRYPLHKVCDMAGGGGFGGRPTHVFHVDAVEVVRGQLPRAGEEVPAVKLVFRLHVFPEQPFEVAMLPEVASALAEALHEFE